jgi:hypothetical protein
MSEGATVGVIEEVQADYPPMDGSTSRAKPSASYDPACNAHQGSGSAPVNRPRSAPASRCRQPASCRSARSHSALPVIAAGEASAASSLVNQATGTGLDRRPAPPAPATQACSAPTPDSRCGKPMACSASQSMVSPKPEMHPHQRRPMCQRCGYREAVRSRSGSWRKTTVRLARWNVYLAIGRGEHGPTHHCERHPGNEP